MAFIMFKWMKPELFALQFSSASGFIVFSLNVSMIVLYCKYAGMPYLSREHYKAMKHLGIVVAIWTVAYITKITTVHYNKFNPSLSGADKVENIDFGDAVLNCALCVGCDLVPLILVVDSKFIKIMTFDLIRKHKVDEDE